MLKYVFINILFHLYIAESGRTICTEVMEYQNIILHEIGTLRAR